MRKRLMVSKRRVSPCFEKVGECLYREANYRRYYALVKVKGKQIRTSLKTSSLHEARRKLVDFRRDLDRVDTSLSRITLADACDKYLGTVGHQAKSTVRQKRDVCLRLKKRWGTIRVKGLIKSDLLSGLAALDLSPDGYNKHLRVLRSILALAVDDRVISISPLAGVKELRVAKPIRRTPSFAEFTAIVSSIRTQRCSDTGDESADLLEFMGLAGLGLAEAGSLTWGDINLTRGQIITFRHKTRQGFAIPIYPQVRPLLERRWATARQANEGQPPANDEKVFAVVNAKKAIGSACSRLRLPHYTSRAFRRLFITTAIERGVDVKVIAQWQGHRDGGKLILDTYSHVRPVHSENMAKLMTIDPPLISLEPGNSA